MVLEGFRLGVYSRLALRARDKDLYRTVRMCVYIYTHACRMCNLTLNNIADIA